MEGIVSKVKGYFTKTTSMKEILQDGESSEVSPDGKLWISKLRDLYMQVFNPEEVSDLGKMSNAKRSEATPLTALPGYVLHPEYAPAAVTRESDQIRVNAEELALVDYRRSLVPSSPQMVFEKATMNELQSTARIYGIKAETQVRATMEKCVSSLSVGMLVEQQDFLDQRTIKGLRFKEGPSDSVTFPDFGFKVDAEEEAEPTKSFEEMAAAAEELNQSGVPSGFGDESFGFGSFGMVDQEAQTALLDRASALVDQCDLHPSSANKRAAERMTAEMKKVYEGGSDEVLKLNVNEGEKVMTTLMGVGWREFSGKRKAEHGQDEKPMGGLKRDKQGIPITVPPSSAAEDGKDIQILKLIKAQNKMLKKQKRDGEYEGLRSDESEDEESKHGGDAMAHQQMKFFGTKTNRKMAGSIEQCQERARHKVLQEELLMRQADLTLPKEFTARASKQRAEWTIARMSELNMEFQNRRSMEVIASGKASQAELVFEAEKIKANDVLKPQFVFQKERCEEVRRLLATTADVAVKDKKGMRWAETLMDRYDLEEANLTKVDTEFLRLQKFADGQEKRDRSRVSEEKALKLNEALVNRLDAMSKGGNYAHQQDGGGKGGGKDGGGKGGGKAGKDYGPHPLDLVDAGVWDASLAGKKAVAPDNREVARVVRLKADYRLDQGLVHTDLKWPHGCGMCLKIGHHFMECGATGLPALVVRDGSSDEIVTLRSLFSMGFAKADGSKA